MKLVASARIALCLILVTSTFALADDWPQWRGPTRDGISKETGLLKKWPAEGPKLLWQSKDVGDGFSTPAIVGDRLYLLGNSGNEIEFVQALNVADGKQVWSHTIGKVGNPEQRPSYPGARSTPTVDGDALYALGSDGDLVCLEAATGKPRWQKNLRSDFGGTPGIWAYAESPLIDGDTLVCTPGGEKATLVALNKKTGDVIWKSAIPGGDQSGYASVIIVETAGVKQYVQFLQNGLVSVDAKTGKFLWRYEQTAHGSLANIPTPIAHGGYIYSGAGQTGGGLVKLNAGQGGAITVEAIYFNRTLPNAIGGSVLLGDYLYGATKAVLDCVKFTTGEIKWTDRSIAPGSICTAEGLLYIHGEDGQVALVSATPDGYQELGRFTPAPTPAHHAGKTWAYPAIANGRLYIRDFNGVWCYDIKK